MPSLSQLHFFYFFKQLRNYFILAYFFEYFAVLEYHTAAVAAGYADVCLLSFARTVYDATHNGNLKRLTAAALSVLDFLGKRNKKYFVSAAGRTRHYLRTIFFYVNRL